MLSPSQSDISALAAIFDIGAAAVHQMIGAISGEAVNPECKAADASMYLCWAETTCSRSGTAEYLSHGTICRDEISVNTENVVTTTATAATAESSMATAVAADDKRQSSWIGGHFPVPPWLQPSATQVLSRLDLRKRPKKNKAGEPILPHGGGIDSARRQHMRQLLAMISKPIITNKERTRQALRRWGPVHEQWWQEVQNSASTRQASPEESRRIAEKLGREARDLIGYQLVNVWTRGPVLLTLHQDHSKTVGQVMGEASEWTPSPLEIVARLVECWIHMAQDSLDVIEKYGDRLDHDLTIPVQKESFEAASWSPVIARCRKAALALLRRCQINEMVQIQLCSAAQMLLQTQGLSENLTYGTSAAKASLPFGRQAELGDISGHGVSHLLGVFHQQRLASGETRNQYKKAEQRFSRLHTILLDRQRLRLLSTQREIHRYFRILVTVEIVFLPIELWYNLDNLNGITTPGRLQEDSNEDGDFWYTVMGFVVWAVLAILLYTIYTKFFERTPDTLRVANIASLQRKQRRLRKQRQRHDSTAIGPTGGWNRFWKPNGRK
ncbi:hypothetical protein LPJ53_003009 [Coemansia erecta]|uniref:Uncharacterized protein n=1 Tax=Coemansia erecta TaxID=147472 RepID=A0A9W8CR99_9FUNG|nr:hypothetical protein LPJ53_003009 [Coemansia erecta]